MAARKLTHSLQGIQSSGVPMNDNGTCQGCAESKEALAGRALRESVPIVPYGRDSHANVPVSPTSSNVLANMLRQADGAGESVQEHMQESVGAEASPVPSPTLPPGATNLASAVMPAPLMQMLMPRAATHIMLITGGSDVGGYHVFHEAHKASMNATTHGVSNELANDREKPLPEPPKAKYKNEHYPGWIRDLIRKSYPGVKDDEVKGDSEGAVKVRKVESVKDEAYERAKKEGKTEVERSFCGGQVIYWIAIDELVDDNDVGQHRRIWDWAYGLKQADAEKELGGCKGEACGENKTKKECVIHRGGTLGNFAKVVGQADIPEVGYVRVTYTYKYKTPPAQAAKPVTGPEKR